MTSVDGNDRRIDLQDETSSGPETSQQDSQLNIPRQYAGVNVVIDLTDIGMADVVAGRLRSIGVSVRADVAPSSEPDDNEIVLSADQQSGHLMLKHPGSGQAFDTGAAPRLSPRARTAAKTGEGSAEEHVELDALAHRLEAAIHRVAERNRRLHHGLHLGEEALLADLSERQNPGGRFRSGSTRGAVLVGLRVCELEQVRRRAGPNAVWNLLAQLSAALTQKERGAAAIPPAIADDGTLYWILPALSLAARRQELEVLSVALAAQSFALPVGDTDEQVRVTPAVGVATLDGSSAAVLLHRTQIAVASAQESMDLEPCYWTPALEQAALLREAKAKARAKKTERRLNRRLAFQVVATFALAIGVPLIGYFVAGALHVHVVGPAYAVIVFALVVTAVSIYVEGLHALEPARPPEALEEPLPAASAIIAAYLPNESATIVDTIEAFLRVEYSGPLQVVLAYNTPRPLPVESTLRRLAAQNDRLVLLKVEGSTSKAQNVNAALAMTSGEFTGVFDADHHPEKDAFVRAARWLTNGYDVVQGHCVIRNGGASFLARTVAVEFESIYAVSHPGRAQLHGFGIFGGSNGYWRSDVLRRVRMRQRMLTEDIDASIRAVLSGAKIASDPALLSYELAPTTVRDLTRQRLRWAQGWCQVSGKYVGGVLSSTTTTARQKAGLLFLLGWREVYPWLSLQMIPLLAYVLIARPGGKSVHWAMPFFLLTSVLTLAVGLVQSVFAYLLAHPSVRVHRRWFVVYALVGGIFYTEFKNTLARVAHLKQLSGEREWNVTPRTSAEQAAEPLRSVA
jgi:cellulose synthase/poly-beta-1,6-N-acetylglucosamine synthase-like glycosyltransferase